MFNSVSVGESVASLSGSSETISDESNNAPQGQKTLQRRKSSLQPLPRPPWKATTNPIPKPNVDKAAIMKAKLLDVSRRAILKAKMTFQNVSMQTDPLPTKLMKDVGLDQDGLIIMKDATALTDGSVITRQTGRFILTNSVAQLTEPISTYDKATQTANPRSEVASMKLYQPDLSRIQQELQEFDKKCVEQHTRRRGEINTLFTSFGQHIDVQLNSPAEKTLDSLELKTDEKDQSANKFYNTYANWTDFDFDSGEEAPSLPRKTIGEGDKPWCNFKDLVLGKRLSQMTLSPIPHRKQMASSKKKSVTWSDKHQRAVNDLLEEASKLIHIFDQVSILLGPKINSLVPLPQTSIAINLEPSANMQIARQDLQLLAEQLQKSELRTMGNVF